VEEWFLADSGVARTMLKRDSEGLPLKDWKAGALQEISNNVKGEEKGS